MKKRIIVISVIILILIAVIAGIFYVVHIKNSGIQKKTPDKAREVLESTMDLIIEGKGTEVEVLGADGIPVVGIENTGVSSLILSKLSYECGESKVDGDIAEVEIKITAPDGSSLLKKAAEETKGEDSQALYAKFDELLKKSTKKTTFDVTVVLKYVENKWYLVPDYNFSNAISGGLVEEYRKIKQDVMDEWIKGVSAE